VSAPEAAGDVSLGRALLVLARGAIAAEFGGEPGAAEHPELERPGATFVTLTETGLLRGCIGTLEPRRTLRADVQQNALNAAFNDPRFPPLGRDELDRIEVEVSLLGPSEPLPCRDEEDLVAKLRPHVDGLVLAFGGRRGTFLPQVWESLPDPREFVRELKRKAGLPADFWRPGIEVSRYAVAKYTSAMEQQTV
jgi:AmmeMemoRadiSam system protein A